jgi:uncharacterized OsmC-like protein
MKSEELKSIQRPLKEKYRNEPDTAMFTLKAQGKIGVNISCKIETGRALTEAGLHTASGGNGMLSCSGDLLLEALVACAGVTLSAIATSRDIEIRNGIVNAEGDLDFRGTLAVGNDAPVGFKEIRLSFSIESDASPEKLETLLKLTEKYCVVYQTIKKGTPIITNINLS